MSASRLGKNWADVDEESEDEVQDASTAKRQANCFETPVDADGIKQVIEYKERAGKTYKVSTKIRVQTVTKWTNQDMIARKTMDKFGKARTNDAATEASLIQRCEEEIPIEICRRAVIMSQANDAEDKFLEEALKNCETLFKEKKVWTDVNRDKQLERDEPAPAADAAKPEPAAAATSTTTPGGKAEPGKYVPPSLRGAAGGKGGGKGDLGQQQEASLRVTNLSEDIKEGDLQDLFSPFGRLQRVFLAKDMETHLSKGFAFITYYSRDDAQKAINKLNGHGYDNLILQVMWAKPKA